jgi:hypothetical protein
VPRYDSCKLCVPLAALLQLQQPLSHNQMQQCILPQDVLVPKGVSCNLCLQLQQCSHSVHIRYSSVWLCFKRKAWCPGTFPASCVCLPLAALLQVDRAVAAAGAASVWSDVASCARLLRVSAGLQLE